MGDRNWRDKLDLVVEQNLNELINETKEFDYAISSAKDKSKAQMWVALAIINRKLNDLSLENTGKNASRIPKDEMSKILKTLETL